MDTRQAIAAYLAEESANAFEHALETMESYAEEAGIVIDKAMQLEALATAIAKLAAYAELLANQETDKFSFYITVHEG